MSQLDNFCDMELTRRKLFLLGAATVTAAGGALVISPDAAQATDGDYESSTEHLTAYDQAELQANPANRLGCPLGKGI